MHQHLIILQICHPRNKKVWSWNEEKAASSQITFRKWHKPNNDESGWKQTLICLFRNLSRPNGRSMVTVVAAIVCSIFRSLSSCQENGDSLPDVTVMFYSCVYYSVRKVSNLIFFLQKPGGFQWRALAWSNLEPQYSYANVSPPGNSVSWWQAAFEWGSV